MKLTNLVTLIILIVGGLNCGLVGLFDWNWFVALFGEGSMLARSAISSSVPLRSTLFRLRK